MSKRRRSGEDEPNEVQQQKTSGAAGGGNAAEAEEDETGSLELSTTIRDEIEHAFNLFDKQGQGRIATKDLKVGSSGFFRTPYVRTIKYNFPLYVLR